MEMDAQETMLPGWLRTALIGRRPKRTLVRAAVLLVVSLAVFKYWLLPIRIEGSSMLPTYKEHGVNFVNRLAYWRHEPRRGDVVAIRLLAGWVVKTSWDAAAGLTVKLLEVADARLPSVTARV